jgi:hypothetical protein
MRELDLTAEWLSFASLSDADRERLGISREAAHRAGDLAITGAHTVGATWQPVQAGRPHLVIAVWNGPAPSIYTAREDPIVIDLIAFSPDELASYFRTGAGAVLGVELLDVALEDGMRVPIFGNVLDWLRADCLGVVLLDFAERRAA